MAEAMDKILEKEVTDEEPPQIEKHDEDPN